MGSRLERARLALGAFLNTPDKALFNALREAQDAMGAALAAPEPAPKQADVPMLLREAVLALLRVVDERDPGLRGYYIDAERFNDLRAALAAQPAQAWRDSFPPTHYCRECRALWRLWPNGSWSLVTMTCGKCCDNVPMGEQIAPLASEYPTLRVERPTALATPGEVAPGAPNQAGVTAGETAPLATAHYPIRTEVEVPHEC